jgi:hypothetical protein
MTERNGHVVWFSLHTATEVWLSSRYVTDHSFLLLHSDQNRHLSQLEGTQRSMLISLILQKVYTS